MNRQDHLCVLADLFDYPDHDYLIRVSRALKVLKETHPRASRELERFQTLLPVTKPEGTCLSAAELTTLQELFIRSFDVQAVTTLDIGYVLFGDDYKRGELLANLSREHRQANNDCGHELGDHLPNLLRLLAKLDDTELCAEMVSELFAPAIRTMIGEFAPKRIRDKNQSYEKHYKTLLELPVEQTEVATLYQFALRSLWEVLKQDFSFVEKITPEKTSDFLGSIQRENEIEENASYSS